MAQLIKTNFETNSGVIRELDVRPEVQVFADSLTPAERDLWVASCKCGESTNAWMRVDVTDAFQYAIGQRVGAYTTVVSISHRYNFIKVQLDTNIQLLDLTADEEIYIKFRDRK